MPAPLKYVLDAAAALGLVLALALVFGLDRNKAAPPGGGGSGGPTAAGSADTLKIVINPTAQEPAGQSSKPLRLAVTQTGTLYDDMGKLLRQLGQGYPFTVITLEDLADPAKTGQYDVIFATCSTHPESWLGQAAGAGSRPGTQSYKGNEAVMRKVGDNVRSFVQNGGTLYASDHQIVVVEMAFPELLDPSLLERGAPGKVQATVNDPSLREIIGDNLELDFPLNNWVPAGFRRTQGNVILEGTYRNERGSRMKAPLLVKVPVGKGSVIFTSFHNEAQHSEKELALLKYLVFGAVTAKEEAKAKESLVNDGFQPKKGNLLTADAGDAPAVTKKHTTEKAGKLRFALGWTGGDAKLRLNIRAPDGRSATHEDDRPFVVEVPDAAAGEWQYTVTAVKVPNPNFPFTVTLGEKEK